MALRLTSNLLYGVALVYKQKTDYLNNDAITMKTRIQRDALYGNNNADRLLISAKNKMLRWRKEQGGHSGNAQNGQVLLNDDVMFNIHTSLLPSLEGLEFLKSTQNPADAAKLQRKDQIREADVENNIVSLIIPSSQSDQFGFEPAQRNVDDLIANDPEFAFDEDGLLLELDITGVNGLQRVQQGPQDDDMVGIELDFRYDEDMPPPLTNENAIPNLLDDMDQIIEVRPLGNDVADEQIRKTQKKRKSRGAKQNVIFDDSISLVTDDLRAARDNYVVSMQRPPTKKQKMEERLREINRLVDDESFLPKFKNSARGANPIRGRPARRELKDDEDFVDGLMRDRGSSHSIEVRRNASSERRRSRSSISSIHLPLNEDMQNQEMNDDYFELDLGGWDDMPIINQGNAPEDASEERSSRKRSSSIVRRFETVQEDHGMDFDIGLGGHDPYAVPMNYTRSKSSSSIPSSQRQHRHTGLNPDEINSKYGKQTLKFLKYIETRCVEEDSDSVTFQELIDQHSRKSIIVKSFYEILQLQTLNQIDIRVNQPITERFQIMNPSDINITP
jgi:hypothetical protein